MSRALPGGTVTFLFTDVEGSTRLLDELGAEEYADALAQHRAILRAAFTEYGGVEVDTQGDAFFFAFPTAPGALDAAAAGTAALAGGPIRVRVGIHTGTPLRTDEGYVGVDVHRAARIAACGHGGQVLVSSSTASLADGRALVDLGLHRLKDLAAPERIHQLGTGEHPPLKSLHRTNLPVPATAFLGRERELGEVTRLLERDDVRLLTLTGPGGTGKTRLAMQAAGLAADRFPHGVWWVALAALRDAALVPDAIAQVLGAPAELADFVADKAMLVLLDNFEHVVEAAPGVAALLAACPNVEVLVTSREPLRVTGEQEYAVAPFVAQESVGFFVARARAVDPGFEPDHAIGELCRRLDDLPLALELAAARVKVLSPAQMLERLDRRLPLLTGGARDLPERQRTLRATIEWSYELLTPDEQELFVRMAVFRGGATLADAETVAGADVDRLQALVDKSLVRHGGDRFWMLETIREYGRELAPDDEVARHAEHFGLLAREAEPHLAAYREDWIARIADEHDNIRAALDRYESRADAQALLATAGALARFWYTQGHLKEGRARLERALALDLTPTASRALALIGSVLLGAETRLEETRHVAEACGDPRLRAIATGLAGSALIYTDRSAARAHLESAIAVLDELDIHWSLAFRRTWANTIGSLEEAERHREAHLENLRIAREVGNRRVEAVTLGALSMNAVDSPRAAEALPLLEQAIALHRELGDPLESSYDVDRLATIAAVEGHVSEAVALYAAGQALRSELGLEWTWASNLREEVLTAVGADFGAGEHAESRERGATMALDEALEYGLALLHSRTAVTEG